MEQAKEEITIITPPFLSLPEKYISIPKYIRKLNSNVKIKIITGHKMGKKHVAGYEEIKSFENTEIVLVKNRIHAKVYIFDGKIAIISSINLTFNSWITSLETGIIVKDEILLKVIKNTVNNLESKIAPISIRKGVLGDGEEPDSEVIDRISLAFETEGEKLRNQLKIDSVLPKLEPEKIEGENGKTSISHEGRNVPISTVKLKILDPSRIQRKQRKKKKLSSKKYTNLKYWTLTQLQRFAVKNKISITNDKKTLIENIERSNPKEKPRLDFVQKLLENSWIFSDHVGITIGYFELIEMGFKLRERYKRYPYSTDMNMWYFMSHFITKNNHKDFIIDLLEEK